MNELNGNYWEDRYNTKQTGWDLGAPSVPLLEYIRQLTDKNLRILIPGCGNAYEAEALMEQGFTDVTLIDIAPSAVARITTQMDSTIQEGRLNVICGDFFEHKGVYDLVLEQTFFCALPPSMRPDYARKMAELIRPGGKLSGVLFNFPLTEEGPPFGGSEPEYRAYFSPYFSALRFSPCYNSIAPRAGRELFVQCLKLKS